MEAGGAFKPVAGAIELQTVKGLPPEFAPDVLRRRYADLADFDDAALHAHYAEHGRAEGRIASEAALREDFLKLIDPNAKLLEIGPYCTPLFTGSDVRYLDVFDAETLRARALSGGLDPANCPETIHYTSGLAECSGEGFDVVFSSHAIEHQPDLVRHLQEVAAALKPGGAYWMIVPDKRFCFDHHLAETTVSNVMDAYLERRTRHTAKAVIDHIVLQDHNDPVSHWEGRHGDVYQGALDRLKHAIAHFEEAQGGYIDVHAWQLTPQRFREILETLGELGLTPFNRISVYDTPRGNFEFMAVLARDD